MSRLTLGRLLRQHLHRRLVTVDPPAPPVAVYPDAAGNRIDPRQHGLARAISVPCTVNSQPGVLQQVFCLPQRRRLAPKESQQGGAERGDQDGRRLWIGLLVTLHPAIQFPTSSSLRVLSQARSHPKRIHYQGQASYAIHGNFKKKDPQSDQSETPSGPWPRSGTRYRLWTGCNCKPYNQKNLLLRHPTSSRKQIASRPPEGARFQRRARKPWATACKSAPC